MVLSVDFNFELLLKSHQVRGTAIFDLSPYKVYEKERNLKDQRSTSGFDEDLPQEKGCEN